ncbi:hypothetical protein G3I34_30370 [Streptomyces sp. SID8014]|uniref:hypothetical protein n=1 Tax=Streptomyces sp. SID8014 TaxID=2706097 RepID=UPI0013B8240B|nr:hypothetical protein [Streptomyces sp. SID8014]NEC16498.1 hypothetical protein [Streptomyces sp. SID8014]
MTDATGDAGHPDVAEISDLAEGLLAPPRSGEVRSHLDACALCADVRSSLEEIRGLLGTLPGPIRMPADVAGRIDAALAAEALLGTMEPEAGEAAAGRGAGGPQDYSASEEQPRLATAEADEDTAEAESTEPVVSRETTAADVSRETSRETVAAETTCPSSGAANPTKTAAASGGTDSAEAASPEASPAQDRLTSPSSPGALGRGGVRRPGRPEGHARGATGPGRQAGGRGRRRRLVLSSVLAAAAIGLGAVLVPALTGAGSDGEADTASSADTGPVYSDRALQGQVSALLSSTETGGGREEKREPGAGKDDSSLGVQSSPETPELNEPLMAPGPELPPCVERAVAGTQPALALERGRYRGTDAFLVVLPDHRDDARVTAYLVDADCVDAGDKAGEILLTRTYPRS